MPLVHLPPNEQWDDLVQSLDFVERRFAEWAGQKAIDPKLLVSIGNVYEVLRKKWANARGEGQAVPTDTGLPRGHVGESPASRSLRYWIHVGREVRRFADEGQLSLAESHALMSEVGEHQATLERRLTPEELPEAVIVGAKEAAGEAPALEPNPRLRRRAAI